MSSGGEMQEKIAIVTDICLCCDERGIVYVYRDEWERYMQGTLIQEAFSNPAPEREQLMTGTHPHCWANVFNDEAS